MLQAQDPVKLAPNKLKVILENDTVRVFEARLQPGDKLPLHSHPKSIAYFMSDFKLKSTFPNGKFIEGDRKKGEIAWRDPMQHEEENTGMTEAYVLVIEFKNLKKRGEK
ncbi:MAG: cytoplasmic protein [Ignavibacteriales bacterium]|nr:cytoplasmic protein [Ignavibacteriales bacterium]